MNLVQVIQDIQIKIRTGQLVNEASVSQGVLLPLLNNLGWSIFDTGYVWPEYSVGAGRVDYALCYPRTKPITLVEVKDIGKADGADRQLFEYAFHQGIPMAILTDGQEWSFFLPAEQGNYQERCVYKLDILSRSVEEAAKTFDRYVSFTEVSSGRAIDNARSDYKNVSRDRQINAALPIAWAKLINEQDELLLELLAERVETICGFKPVPDTVAAFLKSGIGKGYPPDPGPGTSPKTPTHMEDGPEADGDDFTGYVFAGRRRDFSSMIEAMIEILGDLQARDPSFLDRFTSLPRHGRRRRYVAKSKAELYPGRPDLCEEYSVHKFGGWWIGTNYSGATIRKIIKMACQVAGVSFGNDLRLV